MRNMGLSAEERVLFSVSKLTQLLERIDVVESACDAYLSGYQLAASKTKVRGWAASTQRLIGMCATDSESCESFIKNILGAEWTARLGEERQPKALLYSPAWLADNWHFAESARSLTDYKFQRREGLVILGTILDAVSAALDVRYYVWRYDDDVFSDEFKQEYRRLVGAMLGSRFDVSWLGGDESERQGVESRLVLKHKAFFILVGRELQKSRGKAAYFKHQISVDRLCDEIAKMGSAELVQLFRDESEKSSKAASKHEDTEKRDALFHENENERA
jgi:hypothetical protein